MKNAGGFEQIPHWKVPGRKNYLYWEIKANNSKYNQGHIARNEKLTPTGNILTLWNNI